MKGLHLMAGLAPRCVLLSDVSKGRAGGVRRKGDSQKRAREIWGPSNPTSPNKEKMSSNEI